MVMKNGEEDGQIARVLCDVFPPPHLSRCIFDLPVHGDQVAVEKRVERDAPKSTEPIHSISELFFEQRYTEKCTQDESSLEQFFEHLSKNGR